MNFLKSDIIACAVGATVIATFSTLFYFDYTRSIEAGDAEKIGTVTFKRAVAQRKYASQVVWEEVRQHSPVYNYDTIRTSDDSEATLHIKDGSEITLNENSMILVAISKNAVDVNFEHGSIMAKRAEGKGDLGKLNIKSKGTTVSIKKSDVNLTRSKGKDLNLTVKSGNATIKSGKTEQVLTRDQMAVVSKDEETKVYTLNLKLISPPPNQYLTISTAKTTIPFSWVKIKGAQNAWFEISQNGFFTSIVTQRKVTGTGSSATLGKGIYYWRLRAYNKSTKKKEFSSVRRIAVITDEPIYLYAPQNGAVINYNPQQPPLINFKWSKKEIAVGYTLIIATDPGLSKVVKKVQTPGTSIALGSLKLGNYFWRIDSKTKILTASKSKSSPVYKFSLAEQKKIEPPRLIYPPHKEKISSLTLKKGHITFTWAKDQAIRNSKLVIAKDADFKNIIYSAVSNSNFQRYTQKTITEGTYYWRVQGLLLDKTSAGISGSRMFRIIKTGDISLIYPRDNARVSSRGTERSLSIRFSWVRTSIPGKFSLQVSKSKNFGSIYKASTVDTNFAQINNFVPGTYYWKVSFTDPEGDPKKPLMKSKIRSFTIKDKLDMPIALNPQRGNTINMRDRDSLTLRWKNVEGANLYSIALFQKTVTGTKLILQLKTTRTLHEIFDLNKLDEGDFIWTVQAFETGTSRNQILRRSMIQRIPFDITLGDKLKKAKLKTPKVLYLE